MANEEMDRSERLLQRYQALSRWENEGGAGDRGRQDEWSAGDTESDVPQLTNTELVQLRIRVIALENLVISLLARTSDQELELVREMAAYISPRPGFTHHPMTLHAAAQMISLVERASQFRAP